MSNLVHSYKKTGYVLLKNFFRKEDISLILKDAKSVFSRQFIHKGYITAQAAERLSDDAFNQYLFRLFEEDFECLSNCGKQVQHLISIHQLSLQNNVIKVLNEIGISAPVISTRPVCFFNHPKLAQKKIFYKVDAHQDWRSMQGSLNSVVLWLPLIDIYKDLGALEVLPGSHLKGLRTDHIENGFGMVALDEEERNNLISIEMEAGDALLFSSFLIHQSGENVTDRPRWSCHFRYNDLDEPTFIDRKFAHPYIYKPAEDLITPGFPTLNDIENIFAE